MGCAQIPSILVISVFDDNASSFFFAFPLRRGGVSLTDGIGPKQILDRVGWEGILKIRRLGKGIAFLGGII